MKKLINCFQYIPPYLFLWRENDDEVRDIGKHDFRSVLLHPTSQSTLHARLQIVNAT